MTDLGSALCDPQQLENAILKLCINARDGMPDGGRLTIETAGATLNDHDARARDIDANGGLYPLGWRSQMS